MFKNLLNKKYPTGIIAPDVKDSRNYILSTVQPLTVALPIDFDLRDRQSPVQNQRKLGVCYSFATAGISEYWNIKEYQRDINLSERFVVYNTKRISGLWDMEGDYFRNSLQAMCNYGAPLEQDYPFSDNWEDYKKEPSVAMYELAKKYAGKTYWVVDGNLESIKQAVFQNNCPVLIGMPWYESFNKPNLDGRLPLPSGKMVGGHAISGGYWSENRMWFKNSYSNLWGRNGYFYIPFSDFGKYEIWNSYVLLDLVETPMTTEGYVAIQFLAVNNGYKGGTSVKAVSNLNIRIAPNTNSQIITTIKKDQPCEVVDDVIANGNGFRWQKIKF